MIFTIENMSFIALLLLTGLSAGLCFTWTNSITPGIGELDTYGYLNAFQKMNRAILNPLFFITFFGPFFLGLLNLYLFRNGSSSLFWLLVLAVVIYLIGVLLITIFGNVPLNEILEKTDLSSASIETLKELRDTFEGKWNRLHSIRTVSSITSFILLIISLLQNLKIMIFLK